jgi:hypothetical protein
MKDFVYYLKYPDGKVKKVPRDQVMQELYSKLAMLPSRADLKGRVKNATTYIAQLRVMISKIDKVVPMFDVNSKNVYIIGIDNVYFRFVKQNYRLPDEGTIQYLENTIKRFPIIKNQTKVMKKYIDTLSKNINFLKCFHFPTLKETFWSIFHTFDTSMTNCLRPSYISFLKKGKPYYSRDELVMMAKNMGLSIDPSNIEGKCKVISDNDIKAKTLMQHQLYIKENDAKNYVQLYTLIWSYYNNDYLRFPSSKDIVLEREIYKLWNIFKKAPPFDKEYYLYRFVKDDDFLKHLKIGDLFEDLGFISTTRNPFYDQTNNVFGYVLMKIRIPKGVEGIGLCVESYSLFPDEQEIILAPGTLRLTGIDEDLRYYHPNPVAEKQIRKKYEFEYIASRKTSPLEATVGYEAPANKPPHIDFSVLDVPGETFRECNKNFLAMIPSINDRRYFHATIGKHTYLLHLYTLVPTPLYSQYFFLEQDGSIYMLILDENTSTIKLFIEVRHVISVNYIFRHIGSEPYFQDEDILTFVAWLAKAFGIEKVYFHDDYLSYEDLSEKYLQDIDQSYIEFDNPDTHTMNLFSGYFTYYPEQIIHYMESAQKNLSYVPRFNNQPGITRMLTSTLLDSVINTPTEDILAVREKAPLTRLYEKNAMKMTKLLDFYLFVHQYYFYMLDELNARIQTYLTIQGIEMTPWTNNYIIFEPMVYLFEKGMVSYIPTNIGVLDTDDHDQFVTKLKTPVLMRR